MVANMQLYTIGYSKKTAEEFFNILRDNGVKQIVDIRRHNTNQLAGFTKKSDLPWFLDTIAGIGYSHELSLAPSEELMRAYRKEGLPSLRSSCAPSSPSARCPSLSTAPPSSAQSPTPTPATALWLRNIWPSTATSKSCTSRELPREHLPDGHTHDHDAQHEHEPGFGFVGVALVVLGVAE